MISIMPRAVFSRKQLSEALSSQPPAPMAGGWTTGPADASLAASMVAASTSFPVSCELQATYYILHGYIPTPYCFRLMAAFWSRSRTKPQREHS